VHALTRVAGPGAPPIDLVATLGGDGTILRASSLFRSGRVPPVLSFSLGTLGFLLPFRASSLISLYTACMSELRADMQADIDDLEPALESVLAGRYAVLERLRLACTFLGTDGAPLPGAADGTSSARPRRAGR
jgi:NADH kinase